MGSVNRARISLLSFESLTQHLCSSSVTGYSKNQKWRVNESMSSSDSSSMFKIVFSRGPNNVTSLGSYIVAISFRTCEYNKRYPHRNPNHDSS